MIYCILNDNHKNVLLNRSTCRSYDDTITIFYICLSLKRQGHNLDLNLGIFLWNGAFTVAVSKPATLSSIYRPAYQNASNAVDNVINCPSGLVTAHTQEEFQPWLKIDLQALYDIKQVTIFNRQDNYGRYTYNLFWIGSIKLNKYHYIRICNIKLLRNIPSNCL